MPTLRLITFGLENCDTELVNGCRDQGDHRGSGGAYARFSEAELRAALTRQGENDVDLVLDARHFPAPNAGHVTRCTGVHPEIIDRLVHHSHFKWYLKDVVKRQWKEILAKKRAEGDVAPSLVIAVYCRSGKHRSVAVAECLKYIGEKAESLDVLERRDLSRARWGKICKGGCNDCAGYSQMRQSAFEHAMRVWCDRE
jgi:hypothetical protein